MRKSLGFWVWGCLLAGGCIIRESKTVVDATDGPHRPDGPTTTDRPGDPGDPGDPTDPTDPTAPQGDVFEPVAVGFELDAAVDAAGELTDYYQDGTAFPPALVLSFAGEGWFDGTDPDAICYVWAEYRPEIAGALETADGAPLRAAWDGEITLRGQDCAGRVDPGTWGSNAEDLYGRYDGARVGVGLGAMTPFLLEGWDEAGLDALAPALLGEYLAIAPTDAGGDAFVAQDWSSAGLFAWNEATGDVEVDGADLVPLEVPADGPLPAAYVRSWAWWFEDL